MIARLNLGGPAKHVSILTERLDPMRFRTLLVHGRVGRGEEEMPTSGADNVVELASLSPRVNPVADVRALWELVRLIRHYRPAIVHTHTAKAGFVGRVAAALSSRPRPIVVHTYHGHVLEGYFGRVKTAVYLALERSLAHVSDALVGVSQATVDDLVRLRVAPRERFCVVPLGLELDEIGALSDNTGEALRDEVGAAAGDVLAVFAGRLVPIKRVDVLLRGTAAAVARGAGIRIAVIGDGPLRQDLEQLAASLGLANRVRFLGYRADLLPALAAADLAVLTSDNEGTPVWLIEAAAAGVPAIATDAGGVRDVVAADTGVVVPKGDHEAVGQALYALASDPERRVALGEAARRRVMARYREGRLLSDVARLYDDLLERQPVSRAE